MKKCVLCGEVKPLDEYHKMSKSKDGRQSQCKVCHKKANQEYAKNNKETVAKGRKKRYEQNKNKICQKQREEYRKNPQKYLEKNKRWTTKNKNKVNEYRRNWQRDKWHSDINYRLKCLLRSRLWKAINLNQKQSSMTDLLGCTIDELKVFLESKFTTGMSWDNQGAWHIDHIKPCASFDLTKLSEQKKCFHYSNLQPLWAKDNLEKAASSPADH